MRAVRFLMRSFYLAFFFWFSIAFSAYSQVGNEWIDFSQPYFKIPVAKEGIYRLTYSDLQAAGFPVAAVNPSRIKIFHRGVEQSIYVEGQGDAQFDAADFIEFYGQRNDGTQDAGLYKPVTAQVNKYYNLYSDTTCYFLTVGGAAGKRMDNFSEAPGALPTAAFHYDEKLSVLITSYSTGMEFGDIQNSFYDVGEGWMGEPVYENQSLTYTLNNVLQTYPAGGPPVAEIEVVGRGPMQHSGEVYINNQFLTSFQFTGFDTYTISQAMDWSFIPASGVVAVTLKAIGIGGQPDRFSTVYVKIRYPQKTDAASASEKTFILPANPTGKSYVQIENAAGLRLFDVTDPNTVTSIGTTLSTTLNAVVTATDTERKIYGTSGVLTPSIKPVSFRQIDPAQHDYIMISHALLRHAAAGYSDPVKAFAAYRASPEGGSYDTLLVNVQQVYDQFNYGEPSPMAIFNFMKYLAGVKMPKYLLLVGKGLDVYYRYFRNPNGLGAFRDLIPSSGVPASDAAYTAGLGGTTYDPAVATGRLPALKPDDVAAYLDKVKEMEATSFDDLWRKNILHLSGGIEEGEPQLFQSYLKEFQTIAEGYHYGAKVSALAKYSKEIQHVNIAEQVNAGLSLVTFFGHSSVSTLDFDVGYVTDPVLGYKNKGKYPILLMNGCNAGSFFVNYTLFGEDWVLARDKGATGFIGHSSFGFVDLLKQYSETFYQVGYGDSTFIRQGVGDIQRETAKRYMANAFVSPANISQVQQMILLGDPAVKLFGARQADLEINDNHLSFESFDGQPISALSDSFAIKMIVRNFGQAKENTIRIEVVRTLNDNSTITYDSLIAAPKYSDTLTFVVRKGREEGFGNNTFRVTLDPDHILPELNEENNVAGKTLFIPSNGTKNLFPSAYAIVNTGQVSVSFQSTDLLSAERDFLLEIDTAYTFDSGYKKQFKIKGQVLARQEIAMLDADTLVYYWRTKLADPKPGESEEWTSSSFTYIKDGPEGWAQVDFPQYAYNEAVGLSKDIPPGKFEFLETITPVSLTVYGSASPTWNTLSVKISGAEYNLTRQGFYCGGNTLNLIAFDRKSTTPYIGVPFKWYTRNGRACGREPWVINSFQSSQMVTGNNDDIIQYVDNVHAGDSVLLFSYGDPGIAYWPAAAKTKLAELGIDATFWDQVASGEPLIIFGRKGSAPGTAKIFRSTSPTPKTDVLNIDQTITGGYSSGTMSSGLIGPAAAWASFSTRTRDVEATDVVSFDIVGVKLNGVEQMLRADVGGDQDLTTISANDYPYLKIIYKTGDDTQLTAAQLKNWVVAYTPVPEGILVYHGKAEQEKLNEGDSWQGDYGFVNISNKTFQDSLTVAYDIFNQTLRTSENEHIKIKAPAPGDTTAFSLRVSTTRKGGLNDVNVYVNPRVVPEQYYDNNILQLAAHLNVHVDQLNPVLDVVVDGRHLENGDFVSPHPAIVVKVWDEDPLVLKTDTVGVRIFLTYPCDQETCPPTPIALGSETAKWYPATATTPFRVEFNPKALADGTYTLQVEGADARGNKSGVDPYVITFVVKNENTLTVTPPYPNPFGYQVYFGVVITGDLLPDQAALEITNVNGQQVAAFDTEDFPTFHSGKNEIGWDGSANGGPLPNGVYIFKMMLSVEGKTITRQGKLVLLR
jgi:hypothetical protein